MAVAVAASDGEGHAGAAGGAEANKEAGMALLKQAVKTARRVLGDAHPSTQHFANGLATAEANWWRAAAHE